MPLASDVRASEGVSSFRSSGGDDAPKADNEVMANLRRDEVVAIVQRVSQDERPPRLFRAIDVFADMKCSAHCRGYGIAGNVSTVAEGL
jgi:hypothetical protein